MGQDRKLLVTNRERLLSKVFLITTAGVMSEQMRHLK
jgi:hypothetical protein